MAAAPGPRPLRLAWEQVRLASVVRRLEPCRAPRTALHHARAGTAAGRPSPCTTSVSSASPDGTSARRWCCSGGPSGWPPAGPPPSSAPAPRRPRSSPAGARLRDRSSSPTTGSTPTASRRPSPRRGRTPPRSPPSTRGWSPGAPLVVFVGTLEPRKDVPTLVRGLRPHRRPTSRRPAGAGRRPRLGGRRRRPGRRVRRARRACRADRLRRRRRRSRPAALGDRRRLPGPLRGLRAARPRGAVLRNAAGDHRGHGHGRGRRRRGRPGPSRATWTLWPTPWTRELGGRSSADEDRRRAGFAIAARHTWAASAERHLEAYRHAVERRAADRPGWCRGPPGRVTRRARPHHRRPGLRGWVAGRASPRRRRRRGADRPRGGDHRRRVPCSPP